MVFSVSSLLCTTLNHSNHCFSQPSQPVHPLVPQISRFCDVPLWLTPIVHRIILVSAVDIRVSSLLTCPMLRSRNPTSFEPQPFPLELSCHKSLQPDLYLSLRLPVQNFHLRQSVQYVSIAVASPIQFNYGWQSNTVHLRMSVQ